MNRIIKKIILLSLTLASVAFAIWLCDLYLKINKNPVNSLYSDFTSVKNNDNYRIDSHLIYTVNGDEKYRHPLKPKDPNKTNIAFVGDSVTWSFGSDDNSTYPLSFEKIYNQSHQKKALVNNFGTPGYNFDQEYLLIKEKVLPEYQPDIIVWNLNVNDLPASFSSCLFTSIKDHQWIRLSARRNLYYWYGALKTYRPKLISTSKIFSFLWYQLNNTFTPILLQNSHHTLGCSPSKYLKANQQHSIDKLNYLIDELNLELQKRQIKLIITLVPYQQYLDSQEDPQLISSDYFILAEYLNSYHSNNFINLNENIPKSINLNPADEYFLDPKADVSEKGWRHPNQKMYDLMAFNLNKFIENNKIIR